MKKLILSLSFCIACSDMLFCQTSKVYIKEGNVITVDAEGKENQLTNKGLVESVLLIKESNIVVFVQGAETKSVVALEVATGKGKILASKKPYVDGLEGTDNLLNVIAPKLSKDNNWIYFVTEKYATGNELVRVNVNTGKWENLFTAEDFEFVDASKFKNMFLVAQSLIGENGRDIFWNLVDAKGKVVKSFKDEETAKDWLKKNK